MNQDIKDRKGLMVYGMFIKQNNLDQLSELGIEYDHFAQSFEGLVFDSKSLQVVCDILYNLGITHTQEGSYSEGVFIQTTGKI